MQTTKKSPFTQFDPTYYKALRRISVANAEEYRKSVTAGTKHTIDLGVELGKINELHIRGIDQQDPDKEREIRTIAIQKSRIEGSIDLAEAFVNGNLPETDLHIQEGRRIQKEIEESKTPIIQGSQLDNENILEPLDLTGLLDGTISEEDVTGPQDTVENEEVENEEVEQTGIVQELDDTQNTQQEDINVPQIDKRKNLKNFKSK